MFRLPDIAPSAQRASLEGLHLRLSDGAQLFVTGGASAERPLAVVLPIDRQIATRWRTTAAWLCVEPVPDPLTPQQRMRHARGLRAFDARRDGASERAITEALFSAADLPRGAAWKADERRAQALRLLASARAYVHGAYLRLLRLGSPRRRR